MFLYSSRFLFLKAATDQDKTSRNTFAGPSDLNGVKVARITLQFHVSVHAY